MAFKFVYCCAHSCLQKLSMLVFVRVCVHAGSCLYASSFFLSEGGNEHGLECNRSHSIYSRLMGSSCALLKCC